MNVEKVIDFLLNWWDYDFQESLKGKIDEGRSWGKIVLQRYVLWTAYQRTHNLRYYFLLHCKLNCGHNSCKVKAAAFKAFTF